MRCSRRARSASSWGPPGGSPRPAPPDRPAIATAIRRGTRVSPWRVPSSARSRSRPVTATEKRTCGPSRSERSSSWRRRWPSGRSHRMRIVFWNIRAGGGVRVGRIAAQIERWAPDVVALCEFRATPPSLELARSLAALGLAYQCTTAEPSLPSANRLLIATRFPMRRLRLRVGPGDPGRLLLLASVEAPEPLTLGAMHVPNRVTGRKDLFYAAVLTLLGRWRRGPTMLLGATNSGRPGLDEETRVFGPREDAWLSGLERSGWLGAFGLLRGAAGGRTWYSPNGGNRFRPHQALVNGQPPPRRTDAPPGRGRPRGRPRRPLPGPAALLVDAQR